MVMVTGTGQWIRGLCVYLLLERTWNNGDCLLHLSFDRFGWLLGSTQSEWMNRWRGMDRWWGMDRGQGTDRGWRMTGGNRNFTMHQEHWENVRRAIAIYKVFILHYYSQPFQVTMQKTVIKMQDFCQCQAPLMMFHWVWRHWWVVMIVWGASQMLVEDSLWSSLWSQINCREW